MFPAGDPGRQAITDNMYIQSYADNWGSFPCDSVFFTQRPLRSVEVHLHVLRRMDQVKGTTMSRKGLVAVLVIGVLVAGGIAIGQSDDGLPTEADRLQTPKTLIEGNDSINPPAEGDVAQAKVSRAQALRAVQAAGVPDFKAGLPLQAALARNQHPLIGPARDRLVWVLTVHPPSCASGGPASRVDAGASGGSGAAGAREAPPMPKFPESAPAQSGPVDQGVPQPSLRQGEGGLSTDCATTAIVDAVSGGVLGIIQSGR